MVRMKKKRNGGYHTHRFSMTVSASENSGFDLFNMHGEWVGGYEECTVSE